MAPPCCWMMRVQARWKAASSSLKSSGSSPPRGGRAARAGRTRASPAGARPGSRGRSGRGRGAPAARAASSAARSRGQAPSPDPSPGPRRRTRPPPGAARGGARAPRASAGGGDVGPHVADGQPREGQLAGEHLEEQDAGGPDVVARDGGPLAATAPGTCRGACPATGVGHGGGAGQQPRQAEVEQLRPALERMKTLPGLRSRWTRWRSCACARPAATSTMMSSARRSPSLPRRRSALQRLALQVLHHQEGNLERGVAASPGASRCSTGTRRGCGRCCRDRAGRWPGPPLGRAPPLLLGQLQEGEEELQGDRSLQLMVQGPEDPSHASLADQLEDLVPAPVQARPAAPPGRAWEPVGPAGRSPAGTSPRARTPRGRWTPPTRNERSLSHDRRCCPSRPPV